MPKHVVVNPATSVGLTELAEKEQADVIVFGSEYRTAPAWSSPGSRPTNCCSAAPRRSPSRRPVFHANPVRQRQHRRRDRRGRPERRAQTAESLAGALGASVAEHGSGQVDLLVVGSRPEAPEGKVVLSATSDYAVEAATYPVLVIPRGVAIDFGAAPQAAAVHAAMTTTITAATSGSRPSIRSPRLSSSTLRAW